MVVFLAAGAVEIAVAEDDGFTALFDGKTLAGWEQKGGEAKYAAEGGAIVGRSVPKAPNSFLCTKKRYGDFIPEYESPSDAQITLRAWSAQCWAAPKSSGRTLSSRSIASAASDRASHWPDS